ncbi:hypothetical protein [Marinicella sp. W31]|uniref:hypothetical protein n=1 Tax=Marinicella sp. W31 TaxID=3023713 RepID=UPI0037582598
MQLYEIKSYTLVLNKVVFLSGVFESENNEGYQFNVRLESDMLKLKFPTRNDAVLERQMLVKALKEHA